MNILDLSATELTAKVRGGELLPTDIVSAYFKQIETLEPEIDAYLLLMKGSAFEQAKTLENKIKSKKPLGALAGVPMSIKDNICVEGSPTTCASKILSGYKATYNATVIERLTAQDAIILGKTNLDEFAMGSSTENSGIKVTKNPWDTTRVPGGSSGGSAASVAGAMALTSLGSETGGSVRQPASLCGVVGLKPTYGAVSRFGLVAFASSLDQVGPLGRDARDTALIFETIAGHDPKDSTSLPNKVESRESRVVSRTIGIPKEYFDVEGLDPEVAKAMENAIDTFKKEGFTIKEISLPHTKYALPTYYILASSEASANLARFDGMRYGSRVQGQQGQEEGELIQTYKASRTKGFGAEVQRRILIGTFALSHGYYEAYYGRAQIARSQITLDFSNAFKEVDAIISPTTPTPAFKIGEKTQDPLAMYLSDIFTIPVNLAGIPAVSIPCGFSKNNLPIGLQIMASHGQDKFLLELAQSFEKATSREFIKRPRITGGKIND